MQLSEQENAHYEQHHIEVVALVEGWPRRARRLLPVPCNADAGRSHSGYQQRAEAEQPAQRAHQVRATVDEDTQSLASAQTGERWRESHQTDYRSGEQRRYDNGDNGYGRALKYEHDKYLPGACSSAAKQREFASLLLNQ